MIGRMIGFAAATLFTGGVVTGSAALIASDLFGTEEVARVWTAITAPRPRIVLRDLELAKDITFFVEMPVSGHGFSVTTGTSFASASDFEVRKVKARWCYVQVSVSGGAARKITLAQQDNESSPTYTDTSRFGDDELQPFGLNAREAGRLARSHCRFGDVSVTARGGS